MAKIVEVANAMISNQQRISNVQRNGNEYYFLYNNKFKWSISFNKEKDEYFLFFYITDETIDQLAKIVVWEAMDGIEIVTFSTEDLKVQEAKETFRELYQIVSAKMYGLDDIFNEIINE